MCMQSQCALCDRGQQEDRFIPVQFRTITHRLRAQEQQRQQQRQQQQQQQVI